MVFGVGQFNAVT